MRLKNLITEYIISRFRKPPKAEEEFGNQTPTISLLTLSDGSKVVCKVLYEDKESFIVTNPMKVLIIEAPTKLQLGLERFDMLSQESTSLIYKSGVTAINIHPKKFLVAYYLMKIKVYEGLLDSNLDKWIESAVSELSDLFDDSGELDIESFLKLVSNPNLLPGEEPLEDNEIIKIKGPTLH